MNADQLKLLPKTEIPELAKTLSATDVNYLVGALAEKEDATRYNAFLLLQANSRQFPFVYEYWDELEKKLESSNSYQRNIGLKLIAENVRWDKEGKFRKTLAKYLSCCLDEKFITARQTIQGLASVITATSEYNDKIKRSLTKLSLDKYKNSQQKLLKQDISSILKIIDGKSAN